MDEKNNQDIYYDENEEKIKEASKKVAKKATKETGRKLKELAKKAIKELLKKLLSLIPPQVWLIIAAVILVIILIAGLWFVIKDSTFDSLSEISKNYTDDNAAGLIKNITTIDEDERKIKIEKDEYLKEIEEWFKNNSVIPSTLGFYDKDYSALVKFLEAEAVSSFPDLRERSKIGTPVEKGELQGVVQFKRKYSDGSEQLLEYKKYTEFRQELAKFGVKLDEEEIQEQIYFNKNEVESAYNDLKTYFTLDEDYNLIIVSLTTYETKTTYSDYAKEEGNADESSYEFNINVTKQNYQSVIQKYTMPFEFPLALLMVTSNPEFCEEVAKLAMTSEEGDILTKVSFEPKIVIDIQDNLTSTYIKEDYGYTANFKLRDYIKYNIVSTDKKGKVVNTTGDINYDPYPIEVEKTVTASSYKVTENWIDTITSQLCVSEAITWIADYTSVYSKVDETVGPEDTNSLEGDDGGYSEVDDYHKYLEDQQFQYSLPGDTKNSSGGTNTSVLSSEQKKIFEKKTGKNTKISTTTTTINYNKTSSKVKPKWERFLSLLKIEEKKEKYNLKDRKKNNILIEYNMQSSTNKVSPENNLLSATGVLYELLSSNTKTVTFEQIMRDLIDIYTGKIKPDEAEFDFSIYEPGEFTDISGYYYGNNFEEKVWFALIGAGYDEYATAGAMGNFKQESSFRANNVQDTCESRVGSDEVYTQKVNSGQYTRQQFMSDSAGYGLAQWTSPGRKAALYDLAKSKCVGIDDEDMQIEWLLKEMQSYGCKKIQPSIKEATDNFHDVYESSADIDLTQREKYAQDIYNKYHGKTAPDGGSAPTSGSSSQKLNYLFPQGVPTTEEGCEMYLQTVEIDLTTKSGQKTKGRITVHQKLVSDVQKALKKAQDGGFKVYEAAGYSFRRMNNGSGNKLSHHSYGVAIDINVNENYSRSGSRIYAGTFWNPSISEFSIPRNGVLVKAFEEIGWTWGGNWSGSYQDYMHFSYTGN